MFGIQVLSMNLKVREEMVVIWCRNQNDSLCFPWDSNYIQMVIFKEFLIFFAFFFPF